MDASNKEVNFEKYCPTCEYKKTRGEDEPCNTCLETGMRYGTEKPELYKEEKQ